MQTLFKQYQIRLAGCIALFLSYLPVVDAQKILSFGPDEPTASIHYNDFLYGIYKNAYKKLPAYPVKGAYSPTLWSKPYHSMGTGVCNYIYIPTESALQPGRQYRISLTVKVVKAYAQMPYFQSHFGVALTSDLFENYFGLWIKHYVPLGIKTSEDSVSVDFIFRPLCTSNYLVLGVFQGPAMDKQECFACQYGFELYNLMVEQYDDPQDEFVYMCDAFEEERLQREFTTGYDTDTVYFESGSAEIQSKYLSILDSIPSKLRTTQDLITLYAYTDKNGNDNDNLGAARNAAVHEALVRRGIDSRRILMVNYGESRASNRILPEDRKVEIDVNRGKLFQKYYTEALQAATLGDYKVAKTMMTQWLKMTPPENAIYALFDCWGEGEKVNIFRFDLLKNIRSRYYKGKNLKFTFDSLSCEDQKGRVLPMLLSMNHLPDFRSNCGSSMDSLSDVSHQSVVDRIYSEYGFPTVEKVGERGNKALPYMIIHAKDTSFQKRYLPIIQKACEEQLISWENYALLFDKINIVRNGHQRYGTQWLTDENGRLLGLYPFEDDNMVAEYRRQVGLVPLSEEPYIK